MNSCLAIPSKMNKNQRLFQFYERFSSAYGTFWLIAFALSIITQSRVETGAFGVYGFPLMALGYAFWRKKHYEKTANEQANLRAEIAELKEMINNRRN